MHSHYYLQCPFFWEHNYAGNVHFEQSWKQHANLGKISGIFRDNSTRAANVYNQFFCQYHCAFHAIMLIPLWARNPGRRKPTCAYAICATVNAKMLGLSKKNSQICTGNFFKMKILKWKIFNFDWPIQTMAWKCCCARQVNRAEFKCMSSVGFLILSNEA